TRTGEEARIEPHCFYRAAVDEPQHRVLPALFLARLAEEDGRPDRARFWYRRALELEPALPVAQKRARALSATRPATREDLGAPDPAQTLRILDRLAERGWSAPLLEGLRVP